MWRLWGSVLNQSLELLVEFFRNVLKQNLQAPVVTVNVWQRLETRVTDPPFAIQQERHRRHPRRAEKRL